MDEEVKNAAETFHTDHTLPPSVKLASFARRQELAEALKKLEAANFPMQTLFVVNVGMRQVDFLMGKMGYPRIALSAAFSGLLFGLFFSGVIALATSADLLATAMAYVPVAIAFTVIYSVFTFARQSKNNNIGYMMRSVSVPEAIELHVLPVAADQAQQILGVRPKRQAAPAQPEFFLPSQPRQEEPSAPAPQPQQAAPVAGPAEPLEQGTEATENSPHIPNHQGPAAQKFGRLIEDPQEFAESIRQQPEAAPTNERIAQIRAEQATGRYGLRIEDPQEFEEAIRKPQEPSDRS